MDRIILKNIRFYGYHGVYENEKTEGQVFHADIVLESSLKKPGQTDKLEDAVDYSEVYDIIMDINKNNKFNLIEKLAETIACEILSRFNAVVCTTVRIRKPGAVISGEFDWMEIEIERTRDGF